MSLTLSKILRPRAGWYQGDFHAHTHHSDGYHSPADLLNTARAEGLDFFAITDHNTTTAYPEFGDPADILIIPGLEVTMDTGHYNVFGLTRQYDWLTEVNVWPNAAPQSTRLLMEQMGRDELLVSINHPLLSPWAWLHPDTDLRRVHCLEIINDPSWDDNLQANPAAIAMWTDWLNAGLRLTAIGGSDYHHPRPRHAKNIAAERLGLPRTYVYAEALSGQAILTGLLRRRVYVSMGPEVSFQAGINGQTYDIGADMGAQSSDITFTATVSQAPRGSTATIIKNGERVAQTTINNEPARLHYQTQMTAAESGWFRLDVLSPDGAPLAVTNPIFGGTSRRPNRFTYGEFV